MSKNFESALAAWLRSLTGEENRWLDDHHCGVLATLRFATLDINLLNAAIGFWDPRTHCFNFRNNELTPLPEELGAIINWPSSELPCVPNITDYFYADFERYLGLDARAMQKIVHGREVDLHKLVDHFKSCPPARKLFRKRALLFCLF